MKGAISAGGVARRSFVFHWRGNAALALATAAAVAAVTGALIVGDSVRGSLEDRVRERLGRVDHALVAPRFFREELARGFLDAAARRGIPIHAVEPAILLRGAATAAASGSRAGQVNIIGIGPGFGDLAGGEAGAAGAAFRLPERGAAANAALAAAIGAGAGEDVVLYLQKQSDVPAEHALGRREGTVRPLRLTLERVLPDAGLALFGLENSQATPRNIFVPVATLARALGREGLANALLVDEHGEENEATATATATGFDAALREAWTLADAGLRLDVSGAPGYAGLGSAELLLPRAVVEAARAAAARAGAESLEVLTYLANTIARDDSETPYSTVAAVGSWRRAGAAEAGTSPLPGAGAEPLRPGEIVLNDWAAADLEAAPGAEVRLRFYRVGEEHRLVEDEAAFRLRAVVPLAGEAADPGWTPKYPGITGSETMRGWDPPFPIELERLRPKDEDYWKQHRATPKAFVALADGRRLWGSRFGDLTGFRVRPAAGGAPLEETAAAFERELRAGLPPAALGLAFRPVKREGIQAARGGTDFAGLFLGFSSFIIIAALVLVALFYRLAADDRRRELGILAAAGFRPGALARLLLAEGALVVAAGSLLGAGVGVAYAGTLIAGLEGWWRDAVQADFLELHARPASVAGGAAATAVLALATIALAARRSSRTPPVDLLRGSLPAPLDRRRRVAGGAGLPVAIGAAAAAAVFLFLTRLEALRPEAGFFAAGGCLLLAGVALARWSLAARRGTIGERPGAAGLLRLAARSAARAPGRSTAVVSVLACAVFIVIAVGANRREAPDGGQSKSWGGGGFALLARAASPLLQSLSTQEGCQALNLERATWDLLQRARVYAFRARAGDDASCLNLYQPQSPRVLGAPRAFLERGGFVWARTLAGTEAEQENPWLILAREPREGAAAAATDANTARWLLHAGLGDRIAASGSETRLELAALLGHSIFQGEVVISEEAFLASFPETEGHGFFLFEAAKEDAEELAARLEADLAEYGFDVEPVAGLLAAYGAVENTYLGTFQILGGLGVLLGTLGLGAVLYRSVGERRGELALLRAVGFPRRVLGGLVLCETAVLLLLGLLAGGAAAVLAVVPAAAAAGGAFSWRGLVFTLAGILAAGLLAAVVALRSALRVPLVPALRSE